MRRNNCEMSVEGGPKEGNALLLKCRIRSGRIGRSSTRHMAWMRLAEALFPGYVIAPLSTCSFPALSTTIACFQLLCGQSEMSQLKGCPVCALLSLAFLLCKKGEMEGGFRKRGTVWCTEAEHEAHDRETTAEALGAPN